MRRILATAAAILAASVCLPAQTDTLRLSELFTTHVIFPTDLVYADLSNTSIVAAKIVEQNKNMLAMKARAPFDVQTSVSALESNGSMHTYIIVYDQHPSELVIDERVRRKAEPSADAGRETTAEPAKGAGRRSRGESVSTWKTGSAPLLQDVVEIPQQIFHIGARDYDIRVLCENIFAYSDITYMTLSLDNGSGISYDIQDATFVVESKRRTKRTVAYEQSVFPRSRYGTLSAGPGEKSKIVYSFDKMTLSKAQVLKIYFYENGGQRNFVMSVNTRDINRASGRF